MKICTELLTALSNSHKFSPFIRNCGRWTRWRGQFLDRKQKWRYFCACPLKKSPKHSKKTKQTCILTEDLFPLYGQWRSPKRMACALKKSSKHSEHAFWHKSYSPFIWNRGRQSEFRGQIFDRKLLNGRFCACAVNIYPKSLTVLSNRHNFSPVIV